MRLLDRASGPNLARLGRMMFDFGYVLVHNSTIDVEICLSSTSSRIFLILLLSFAIPLPPCLDIHRCRNSHSHPEDGSNTDKFSVPERSQFAGNCR